MKNYVAQAMQPTVVATADVAAGEFVVIGSLTGVAQSGALATEEFVLVRTGAFKLPKVSAQAWTQGQKIYWSAANSNMTTVASGNLLVGSAYAAAANPSAEGIVILDGAAR